MPVRRLPARPNLEFLKHQAKSLLKDLAAHDLAAAQRVREFHPRFANTADPEIFSASLRLSDSQLIIAREAGYSSWSRLKLQVQGPQNPAQPSLPMHERIQDPVFRRGVDLIDAGDVVGLRQLLQQHPDLRHHRVKFEGENYFRNPSLLEFIAENPIRRGSLPSNIVEVAKVLLDAGAERSAINETLTLVVTGRIVRERGVQVALINLLCDFGADPSSALMPALQGGIEGVNALLRRGAKTSFPVLAALGDSAKIRDLLATATADERHLALALASQFGKVEIVRILLDAGEDPNRYNPVGCHSHSTPLHQAVTAGHIDVLRLLLDRGANPHRKDILWHATPQEWAQHEGQPEAEALLRSFDMDTRNVVKGEDKKTKARSGI
ncbi:MAG: ankyrin repeat domain-containing protein [Acidobacteria bacterium]|nr:ankyrin repeat domain-containing protein [Acidobacteriota bacterium]